MANASARQSPSASPGVLAAGAATGVGRLAGALAGRRDEDVRPAARLSRRARRERADGPGPGRDRLGRRRPAVGDRDARLHAGSARDQRARAESGAISVLEDTNRDGRMDKKTVFLDGLVLPRALKVLDKGVLVAEPPHLWLARDTNGDLKADSQDAGLRLLRQRARQRRAQRERPAVGDRQLDAHVRGRHLPPLQERQVRDAGRRCRAASGA